MSNSRAYTVELPNHNPFAEERPRAARSGGQPSGRSVGGRGLARARSYDDAESGDDGYGGRGNLTVLPSENPFGQSDTARSNRSGAQSGGRPNPRATNRPRGRGDADESTRGVTVLPHENPFAARDGPRRGPRIIEPVDPPSDPEPEEEEDEEEEEFDYPPPPPPRSNQERSAPGARRPPRSDERQRNGNPRNSARPSGPPEDDRLVISWVDEAMVSPPRSPSPRHGHRHSSVTSESESYFHTRPNRARSPSRERGLQSNSHNRDHQHNHEHGHHHHHHHHDRHCRQCYRLDIPPWQPPFPMPPADWSGYGAPRSPYSPAPPYPYGRPLYADIPGLPSLLDQCRVPYPPVPVAPVAFLRDLLAQRTPGSESPVLAVPTSIPLDVPNPEEWKNVMQFIAGGKTELLMPLLKAQEFSTEHIDRVFRRLTNVVQVRFGERQGNEIVNRVHLVPRGRFAMGTVMAKRPKIDVDLVIPNDFILRRWNTTAGENDESRPKTIADALDLHPTSINRGEIEIPKLRAVFQAIWEQFNGSADGFIFPGGRDEAERYLPKDWCSLHKDNAPEANRLRLITLGAVQMEINIFVKVSLSLYGQDMIVGVDRSSAKSAGKFQLIKTLRTPGVSLSEAPLSPTLRTALLILCWSQYVLKPVPTIRASHFHLALTALQQLPPSDPLYIPPPNHAEPFSLAEAAKVMLKIIKFLARAYKPSVISIVAAPIPGPSSDALGPAMAYSFPLSSCTIADTLYIQASAKAPLLAAVIVGAGKLLTECQAFDKALSLLSGGLPSMASQAVEGAADAAAQTATAAATDALKDLVSSPTAVTGSDPTGEGSKATETTNAEGNTAPTSGSNAEPTDVVQPNKADIPAKPGSAPVTPGKSGIKSGLDSRAPSVAPSDQPESGARKVERRPPAGTSSQTSTNRQASKPKSSGAKT